MREGVIFLDIIMIHDRKQALKRKGHGAKERYTENSYKALNLWTKITELY